MIAMITVIINFYQPTANGPVGTALLKVGIGLKGFQEHQNCIKNEHVVVL